MAKKKAKVSRSRRARKPERKPAASRPAPAAASLLPVATPAQVEAAKEKFDKGILARGEAVPAGQPLPPGATHEIVTPPDGGEPVLQRKRFSLRQRG